MLLIQRLDFLAGRICMFNINVKYCVGTKVDLNTAVGLFYFFFFLHVT